MLSIEEEIGDIEEPDVLTKEKMDREYNIWKIITIIVTIVALGIYIIPMLFLIYCDFSPSSVFF